MTIETLAGALEAAYLLVGASACTVAVVSDLTARTIPRAASHVLVVAGVAYQALTASPIAAAASAAASLAVFAVLAGVSKRAPSSFGIGDARMGAAVVAYLGVTSRSGVYPLVEGLVVAALAALVAVAVLWAAGKLARKATVPLAPALACWAISGAIAPHVAALV